MGNKETLLRFISEQGYKRNSPDKNRPFNIIPSNNITMQDVDFPVLGVDNLGNQQLMQPGKDYIFPGDSVFEIPIRRQFGGDMKFWRPVLQTGGQNPFTVSGNPIVIPSQGNYPLEYRDRGDKDIDGLPFSAARKVSRFDVQGKPLTRNQIAENQLMWNMQKQAYSPEQQTFNIWKNNPENTAQGFYNMSDWEKYLKSITPTGDDVPLEGLETGKAYKRGKTKGSCSTGEVNRGECLSDNKQFGGIMFKSPSMVDYEQPSNELINDDYNMERALELGYEPDERGHWPSVDYETGEWLKSKKHHTRGMEMMAYELNPELRNRYNLIENEKGIPQYVDKKEFQTGGSIPGSVGFTYARTQGIPSEGKYAKKTMPSAQNGVDMYGNPIIANIRRDDSVTRTNYNPRTNTIMFGSDLPLFLAPEIFEKTLAHENRHAWQFANDRTNFDMVHNPEYAFQERLKKRPEFPSTDEVFENYHNRKAIESQLDEQRVKANNPNFTFVPNDIIYNKIVDHEQYLNPQSVEGEAEYYQETGEEFKNDGWLDGYDNVPKAQVGGEKDDPFKGLTEKEREKKLQEKFAQLSEQQKNIEEEERIQDEIKKKKQQEEYDLYRKQNFNEEAVAGREKLFNQIVNKSEEPSTLFHEEWMASPQYQKLLAESTKENNFFDFYNNIRNSNLKELKGKKTNTSEDSFKPGAFAYFDPNTRNISYPFDSNNLDVSESYYNDRVRSNLAHEKSHFIDNLFVDGQKRIRLNTPALRKEFKNREDDEVFAIPKKDVDLINQLKKIKTDDNKYMYDYFTEPTEVRARLNQIREDLYNTGNKEFLNRDVNEEDLKHLFDNIDRSDQMHLRDLDDYFGKDNIIKLLNSISQNNTPDSQMPVAQMGASIPQAQKGGTWLGNKLNSQGYITSETKGGNRISFTGDQRADDWINKQIDTGKFGFDPTTGGTFPLKKPVKGLSKEDQMMATREYGELTKGSGFTTDEQESKIKSLPKEQQEFINQANRNKREKYVASSMQEAYQHPLMSPGYFTPEGALIGAMQGVAKLGPDLYEGNYLGAAGDLFMTLPITGPYIGQGFKTARTALSKIKNPISKNNKKIIHYLDDVDEVENPFDPVDPNHPTLDFSDLEQLKNKHRNKFESLYGKTYDEKDLGAFAKLQEINDTRLKVSDKNLNYPFQNEISSSFIKTHGIDAQLTPAEKLMVDFYQHGYDSNLNARPGFKNHLKSFYDPLREGFEEMITRTKTKKPEVFWRNTDDFQLPKAWDDKGVELQNVFFSDLKPGFTYEPQSFMSTSLNPLPTFGSIRSKINVPENQSFLFPNSQGYNMFYNELENILPSKLKFRIDDILEDGTVVKSIINPYLKGGLIKAQEGKNIRIKNADGSISVINTDSPEYREMYASGMIQHPSAGQGDNPYFGGILDEVSVTRAPREKGFWEKYRDKIVEENKDAGLLGAIIGTPISAVTSLPQLAATYALTDKMQRPSEALDIQNPYGAFAVDFVADPANYVGAGLFDDAVNFTGKAKNLFRKGFKKPIDVLSQLPGSGNVAPVVNTARNLEDLKAAQKFAQQYGYELPANIERIAQSNQLTDRTIRGMMDRHNTFVRGVSTNWDELAKRNPEILRHLEGKGFDLSTKEGTKQAAEYMATHVPIQTGYGRANLNQQVFKQGLDAIYTSNSIPTAEGYTYGQGYITKVKKPTDFSSLDRKDWITKNNPEYYKNTLPSSRVFSVENLDQLNDETAKQFLEQGRINSDEYEKILKYFDKAKARKAELLKEYKINELPESFWDFNSEHDKIFDTYTDRLKKEKEAIAKNLFYEDYSGKILRTERAPVSNSTFHTNNIINKFLQSKGKNPMSSVIGTPEGEKIYQEIINIQRNNPEGNKAVLEFLQKNYPDFDPVDRYSHYLHLGTPGEKILEPIKSWEITPETWKNKSRAHSNTYSKKLSAMEKGGIINDIAKKKAKHQNIYGWMTS